MKKLQKKDLKGIKGGNPEPPGADGSCPRGWRLCVANSGELLCVESSQIESFCIN